MIIYVLVIERIDDPSILVRAYKNESEAIRERDSMNMYWANIHDSAPANSFDPFDFSSYVVKSVELD